MTVCIAAIADYGETIVSCVDTRVSTGTTSFDPLVGRKISGCQGWTLLNCGTFSQIESLLDAFYEKMRAEEKADPHVVQACLEAALRSELPKFSAAKYLTPYGLTMKGFFASRSQFTDERWNELSRLMLDYSDSYDVELIVSGWGTRREASDIPGGACIFGVSRDGVVRYSDVGFHACGSGGNTAHSILSFFDQEPSMTLAETIYHVADAKFMSERSADVGDQTVMRVATRTGPAGERWKGYFIQFDELDEIREIWLAQAAPRIPAGIEERIANIVERCSKHQSSIEQPKQLTAQKLEPKQ